MCPLELDLSKIPLAPRTLAKIACSKCMGCTYSYEDTIGCQYPETPCDAKNIFDYVYYGKNVWELVDPDDIPY